MGRVAGLLRELRAELVELEPGAYDGDGAAALAEELAVPRRRVRRRGRGWRCVRWSVARIAVGGHADAQDWMATVAGSSVREARSELDTVREVEACPDTQAALVGGEVSLAQAAEIAKAEAEVAGVEGELLDVARGVGRWVRCAPRRASGGWRRSSERSCTGASVAARELRSWTDELGMVCGSFRLPPVPGQAFVTRLEREAKRLGARGPEGRWSRAVRGAGCRRAGGDDAAARGADETGTRRRVGVGRCGDRAVGGGGPARARPRR